MDISKASLIGIDWGTTSFRAFLIGERGEVLDRLHSPDGIMQVTNADFDAVFMRLLDPWLDRKNLPVIASGMITSRNGWIETPYLPAPTGKDQLAGALEAVHTINGSVLHFVTGVMVDHSGAADVMRGEETQIVGAVESGLVDGICVMPGTHSKWVTVRDGQIEEFETVMSGEVFEALRSHTILGKLMIDSTFSEAGFREGVLAGLDAGLKLLQSLFRVRTLPLFGKINEEEVADYLSGMLIGAEINGAVSGQVIDDPITIIGRGDLTERYAIALEVSGQKISRVPEDIAARGYFAIAAAAGLMS